MSQFVTDRISESNRIIGCVREESATCFKSHVAVVREEIATNDWCGDHMPYDADIRADSQNAGICSADRYAVVVRFINKRNA